MDGIQFVVWGERGKTYTEGNDVDVRDGEERLLSFDVVGFHPEDHWLVSGVSGWNGAGTYWILRIARIEQRT